MINNQFSCYLTDIWHPTIIRRTETWWHRTGDLDLLWSCKHQQQGEGHLQGRRWSFLWIPTEGPGFICRLQVWHAWNRLWENCECTAILMNCKSGESRLIYKSSCYHFETWVILFTLLCSMYFKQLYKWVPGYWQWWIDVYEFSLFINCSTAESLIRYSSWCLNEYVLDPVPFKLLLFWATSSLRCMYVNADFMVLLSMFGHVNHFNYPVTCFPSCNNIPANTTVLKSSQFKILNEPHAIIMSCLFIVYRTISVLEVGPLKIDDCWRFVSSSGWIGSVCKWITSFPLILSDYSATWYAAHTLNNMFTHPLSLTNIGFLQHTLFRFRFEIFILIWFIGHMCYGQIISMSIALCVQVTKAVSFATCRCMTWWMRGRSPSSTQG